MGLAPDGGLFVPERIPQVDMERVEYLAGRSYADMAAYLASEIMDDMDPEMLRKAVHEAYDFPIVLRHLDGKLYTLELFHGPTFAFKDFGARFMGRVAAMLNGGRVLTVLAATSGDTGSAVAHGFRGVPGVRVVILYPEGKVSPLQEAQMTTLGGNIYPLRVDGMFDDCQRLVKEMFCDETLRRMNRKYDTARFYESVTLLRRYFDRPAITTDLICGFPGETEAEFDATLSFIEKCGFAAMHIFPYSIRPGTKAAAMEQVPSAVKEQRAGRAAQAAETMRQAYLQGCVGRVYPVLFEQEKDGYYTGHAPNYCEVGVRANDLHNKVLDIRIIGINGEMLIGELT